MDTPTQKPAKKRQGAKWRESCENHERVAKERDEFLKNMSDRDYQPIRGRAGINRLYYLEKGDG